MRTYTSATECDEVVEKLAADGLPVPAQLRESMTSRWWKVARLDSPTLRAALKLTDDPDLRFRFELTCESVDGDRQLFTYMEKEASERRWKKITKTGDRRVPDRLPWLNVEKAVLFCTGADIGDDLFIMLDYRTGIETPRVVYNQISVRRKPWRVKYRWAELRPSFEEFLSLLDVQRLKSD